MTKQTHQEWLDGENMPESTIDKIKKIIKTNTRYNAYRKSCRCEIGNDDLFKLNKLIKELNGN